MTTALKNYPYAIKDNVVVTRVQKIELYESYAY